MRWLADECAAAPMVEALRNLGHDVLYVAESAGGAADANVIEMAAHEGRLLLTEDKDFGDLVFRRGYAVPGVILMRTDIWNLQFQMQRLVAAIEQYGDQLFGHYVVVEDGRLRARELRTGGREA